MDRKKNLTGIEGRKSLKPALVDTDTVLSESQRLTREAITSETREEYYVPRAGRENRCPYVSVIIVSAV